jgi:hypothetical protein
MRRNRRARPEGFEPPTFGSGVPFPAPLSIWEKPDFQGEMSCFPLRTFSQKQRGLNIFCDMHGYRRRSLSRS